MALNILEDALVEGINDAANQYQLMAGTSLCHAPESFLQMKLVDSIYKKEKYWVYPDISIGRIFEEIYGEKKGVDDLIKSKRPDISVWYKTTSSIRAIVEIKRTWHSAPIVKDAGKLRKIISNSEYIKCGYIVGYWEFNDRNVKPKAKFSDWAYRSEAELVAAPTGEIDHQIAMRNGGFHTWGAAIIRVVG